MTDWDVAAFVLDQLDWDRRRSRAEAIASVLTTFVFETGFYQIVDWRLRLACVHAAAQAGIPQSVRWLQAAVGCAVDGVADRHLFEVVSHCDAGRSRDRLIASELRTLGYGALGAVVEAA